jgi:NAD(P)H-hydrate epimerase
MLIDGIAGTGLRGGLAGQSLELVRHAAASTKRVIAIDLPSGFRDSAAAGDSILPAFWTLAIEPRKQCLYAPGLRPLAGRIVPVGGVFPIDASFESRVGLFEDTDWTAQSVDVPAAAHKGQRGRLAVLAGSPGMAGSALLAIRAAQASGAGLVTLFVESGLFPALAAASPEVLGGAIVRPELAFEAESPGHNAVLVGPGWATSEEHGRLLASLLASGKPLVIDASALRLLARLEPGAASSALVLTPHPGEMAALAGYDIEHILSDPAAVLPALARRWRAAVILKAATSWMADREGGLRVLEGNEAGLGVAGSGDVLAGVVAGLLAGFAARSPGSTDDLASKALGLAAFAHLRAGRRARAELGWFNAVDLIPRIASSLGLP